MDLSPQALVQVPVLAVVPIADAAPSHAPSAMHTDRASFKARGDARSQFGGGGRLMRIVS